MQAAGVDGQAVQLSAVRFEGNRQRLALEVVLRERIVAGTDAVLEGQEEADGRLPGAADPHQDHVCQAVLAVSQAVVGSQGEVQGIHAGEVGSLVMHVVVATHAAGGPLAELLLQEAEAGAKEVEHPGGNHLQFSHDLGLGDGGEHEWAFASARQRGDLLRHPPRGLNRGDEGPLEVRQRLLRKVREQGTGGVLRRQAGVVRDDQDRAWTGSRRAARHARHLIPRGRTRAEGTSR